AAPVEQAGTVTARRLVPVTGGALRGTGGRDAGSAGHTVRRDTRGFQRVVAREGTPGAGDRYGNAYRDARVRVRPSRGAAGTVGSVPGQPGIAGDQPETRLCRGRHGDSDTVW